MKTKRALRLAVRALEKQIQNLAFDANLFENMSQSGYARGERASKERAGLREALAILLDLGKRSDL